MTTGLPDLAAHTNGSAVADVDGYLVYTFVQTILRTVIYVHNQYRF